MIQLSRIKAASAVGSKVEIPINQQENRPQKTTGSPRPRTAGTGTSASTQRNPGNPGNRSGQVPQNRRPGTAGNGSTTPSSVAARTAARANSQKKRKRTNPAFVAMIILLVLTIAVFAGIGVYTLRYANYNKILPNVYVSGVDVGGMTKQEATAAIEAKLSATEQKSVNVLLPDRTLTFSPQQDTVLIDVAEAVDAAYAYGRTSTNPFAISRAIKAAKRRRNDIDISTAVTVDTAYIHDLINTTAAQISSEVTESVVDIDVENRIITVIIGSPGYGLDTETLFSLVSDAFATGDYSDISFDYKLTYPATVVLDRLYEQLSTEPQNAYYDPASGEIQYEQYGYTPNTDLVEANEQLAMAQPGDVLTFDFSPVDATIHYSELAEVLFRDELYSHSTVYDASNPGRTTNLRLACEAIDGYVVQPGEVFSFNEVVGERTAAKGYQEAVVYVNGNSEPALGGGICQVASTIYYCCMYADLEIVERQPHMFFVTYVPGGLDATVYWGVVDYKFRNNTDYPIRIDAGVYDGCVNIALVGTDVNHYTVEIESRMISSTPFTTVTKSGTGDDVSGYTGYVYEITRYVYDSDGNLIRTDTTQDLDKMGGGCGTSEYEKRDKVVYSGGSGSNDDSNSYTPDTPDQNEQTTDPSPEPSPEPSPDSDSSSNPFGSISDIFSGLFPGIQ